MLAIERKKQSMSERRQHKGSWNNGDFAITPW